MHPDTQDYRFNKKKNPSQPFTETMRHRQAYLRVADRHTNLSTEGFHAVTLRHRQAISIQQPATGYKTSLPLLLLFFLALACTLPESSPELTALETPALSPSAEPSLFTDHNGITYLSWVEKADTSHILKYASLTGDGWSAPKVIASAGNWFVNWADYPMFSTDGNGNYTAHVLRRSADGKYTYDVDLLVSKDGENWKTILLNTDSLAAEHGFVTHIPYGDKLFVTWLDGRNTVTEGSEVAPHHEDHHGAMSIRAAIMDYDGNRIQEWELDNKTCDCCQTTAAITDNGPIVIYRDRSDEEIRDMSIVRLVKGKWTSPEPVFNDNWKIAGCPVNGPRVSALGNTVAVAWFAAPEEKPQVKVIFSSDGGETFSEPVRIDEGNPIGRVDIVLFDKENAMVSWMEGSDIRCRKVSTDLQPGRPLTISKSSAKRSSGFPQMEINRNNLVFAWTDDSLKIVQSTRVRF